VLTSSRSWEGACPDTKLSTGILAANRTLYEEAEHVLYSQNKLDFAEMGLVEPFLEGLSDSAKSSIRSINIHGEINKNQRELWSAMAKQLSMLGDLRSLTVHIFAECGSVSQNDFSGWISELQESVGEEVKVESDLWEYRYIDIKFL
jgi:hypothetical protein